MITKSIAKIFANFLKNNAIIYYNDSFKDYLELFIEYEMWMNNGNDSEGNIYKLRRTLKACEEEKQILEKYESMNKKLHKKTCKIRGAVYPEVEEALIL